MKKRIIAMIPARIGSMRLPRKNLAILDGKPLISYAINAAKEAGVFHRIVLNSEDALFSKIASRYSIEFYQRSKELGGSEAKSDSVVYDFMKNNSSDILAWVNPTSPLQSSDEIKRVVEYFVEGGYDSLITVKEEKVHCLLGEKPINFDLNELFARTQDLKPVRSFVYSVMMWKYESFLKNFEKNGYALLSGKVGYYPVSRLSSIIIKTIDDLRFAEYILTGLKAKGDYQIEYDLLVEENDQK